MKARGQLEGVSPLCVGSMLAAKHQVNHLGAHSKGNCPLTCCSGLQVPQTALYDQSGSSLATAENWLSEARVSELRALLRCLWTRSEAAGPQEGERWQVCLQLSCSAQCGAQQMHCILLPTKLHLGNSLDSA